MILVGHGHFKGLGAPRSVNEGHSHSKDFGGPRSFLGFFCGWAKQCQNIWWATVISRSFGWDTVILKILVGHGRFQVFFSGVPDQDYSPKSV